MSYQGPVLIREPDIRWPIVILAALITTLIALIVAGMHYVAMNQPFVKPYSGPYLERALRPGEPAFEQVRGQIEVDQLVGTESLQPFNGLAVNLTAKVKNNTERTINGLEMRGAILDGQNSSVNERTVVVIPARQTVLEPGEAISVHILLDGISKNSERAYPMMEVTAVSFD